MPSICCEQLWFLLHDCFVCEVDGLLCQQHLVTARWISALVGCRPSLFDTGPWEINVITSQLLKASRVGSQGLRAVQLTRIVRNHEELVA